MCARDRRKNFSSRQCELSVEIPKSLIHCFNSLPEPCGIKNLHSSFLYVNFAFKKLLGLPLGFNVIGKSESDLPSPLAEFSKDIHTHEKIVEFTKERVSALVITKFSYDGDISAFYFDRLPCFNNQGNSIGTVFHARPAKYVPIEFFISPNMTNVELILSKPDDFFSNRQWDVIFMTLRGMSQKEISIILNKSQGYINNVISKIYAKSKTHNAEQFIEYAKSKGWDHFIPENFISPMYKIINPR